MRNILISLIILIPILNFAQDIKFEDYFTEGALRIDFIQTGSDKGENIIFQELLKEKYWAGNPKNLIDNFGYGAYRFMVYDKISNKLIHSGGFNSLFEEWLTTDEAIETEKAFNGCLCIPFPINDIRVEIFRQTQQLTLEKLFEKNISPNSYDVRVNDFSNDISYSTYMENGNYKSKVDIAVIAEGYTKNEQKEFRKNATKILDALFETEPFKSRKSDFNVYLIEAISAESGTDIPKDNIWKNTILDSRFYTFGSERYLTTANYQAVKNVASVVPCDEVMIIVNTTKYGGGGIYNFYNISAGNNPFTSEVVAHELGHSFAGLADEYYSSSTSYNDFFDLSVEPWQPNITTLIDFNKKWKDMLDKDTEIPTSVTKESNTKLGVYEGGGYIAKGMYRPYISCKMKELNAEFCPVCQKSINIMIDFYVK